MASAHASVLAINAGSSSIRFAVYTSGAPMSASLSGKLDRIGLPETRLTWRSAIGGSGENELDRTNAESATRFLIDWLEPRGELAAVIAVGHRVVHGISNRQPVRITPATIEELRRATPYAPDHLPREIELIEAFRDRRPTLPQVACFDTAFHASMPAIARLLPIPRRYQRMGIQRYGFHGLSYAYLIEELGRAEGPAAADGRVILAHLGNGASLAAVRGGVSIDTSMGFTPAAGMMMSTRTGDIDPGIAGFLAQAEQMTLSRFHEMVNQESGLLGVSESSSDMQDLLAREAHDSRAAEAVALFCYQATKWVGAFTAALGGLDRLVFSGGIGERSASIRTRICGRLGFLGIELDEMSNEAHAATISTDASRVAVHVIPTDEERMIARTVFRILGLDADTMEREA
jgi:acetate kinase